MRRLCLLLVLLLVPLAAAQTDEVDIRVRATDASGWSASDRAIVESGAASTSTDATTMRISGFQAEDVPILSVSLGIVVSQVGHADDVLDVSMAGCPGGSVSPASIEPTVEATEFGLTLQCSAWSQSMLENITISVTSRAVGAILVIDGIDGAWRVHDSWLDVRTTREAAVGAGLITVPGDAPVWPFWVAGVVLIVAAVVVPGIIFATRRAQKEETLQEALRRDELVQFLNNASHDLASPLTPIRIQLSLLTGMHGDKPTAKQSKALEVVRRNVEQMGMLVTDLKDASRLQAGRLDMHPESGDLAAVIGQAADSLRPQFKEKGLRLTVSCPKQIPVHVDAPRITQVLYNLLGNALKFTENGTVALRVLIDTDVRVEIKDHGIGLSPEGAARLFQPFSQAHDAKQKAKGSGLGLYICKGIIEAHGGRIGVESEGPGKGSTFWFTLPLGD